MLMCSEQPHFSLANWTTWHIGGTAERFVMPQTQESLSNYLKTLPPNCPITWLGLGSNVLIQDGGIPGSVICTQGLDKLYQDTDGTIVAQAGVSCAKLARFACKLGYADAGFFAGIPGTVGGALAMNAGAFGQETWPWVDRVSVVSRDGQITLRAPSFYDIAYRHVVPKTPVSEAFLSGHFRFPRIEGVDGLLHIRELLRKRKASQPIGSFNCGSVFRNPPGDFAARLIEACGLKGYRCGDAVVSEKHANFIINLGKAASGDVLSVMQTISCEVESKFGILLVPEVKILGLALNEREGVSDASDKTA